MKGTTIGWVVLIVLGLVAPFIIYPVLVMKILCFALFACAFNLLLGYTGLLSFGHAAFLGWAGYVCGYVMKEVGLTPELGILAGTAMAAGLGFLFGSLAIRPGFPERTHGFASHPHGWFALVEEREDLVGEGRFVPQAHGQRGGGKLL